MGLRPSSGGGFSLSSEIGEGTRADLYLPVADEAPQRDSNRVPLQASETARPLSILLVDDEHLVRIGTGEMIRDLGHRVMEASGGFEALAMLAEGHSFDAIVTDYKMPGMDGAELVKKVRDIMPDMPVLLITGYTGTSEGLSHLPRLSKPFGQVEIAAALAGLFADPENVIKFPAGTRQR